MNNYPIFRYITGNSKIHLMNSKMKILWFLLSFILLFIIRDFISLFIFSLVIFYLMFMSKINFKIYIKNLFVIWPVFILLFILSLFSINFGFSIILVFKAFLFVIIYSIITFTTSLSEIAWGFECLFSKLKKINIPVSKISLRIAFCLKFVSNLFEQSRNIRKSMAYRGVPYKINVITSFKKMVLPVLRLSTKLSSMTISAMKLRFYGYKNKRTNYHENKTTEFDRVLILIMLVLIYFSIWKGWIS